MQGDPKPAPADTVMLGCEKKNNQENLRIRETDYDDIKQRTVPRNTDRMVSKGKMRVFSI